MRISRMFAVIGPGLLVAATGVGAGDLATGAFSGRALGVAVLWAVVVGAALKFVLTEGLARWQIATGETLLEGAMDRLGLVAKVVFALYLFPWTYFVGSALISACGVTASSLVPVFDSRDTGKVVFGIALSLLGIVLVRRGGYRLFEKVMSICIGVMFVTVVATAILIRPDWGAVVKGTFLPSIPDADGQGLGWTVALMGGVGGTLTVLCYGYWIREEGRDDREGLRLARIDLGVGYLVTMLFGMAMVVIGSSIPAQGKGSGLIVALAEKLGEPLGPVGRWAFLLGAFGAVFSSLLGVWQAVPYVFADFWRKLSGQRGGGAAAVDTTSRPYRLYLYAIGLIPIVGLFGSFKEVQKAYAVVGALFIPLLALTLLLLNGRKSLVGERFRNRPGWTAALLLALLIFLYFGWVTVGRKLGF